jgi:hypothetical protein
VLEVPARPPAFSLDAYSVHLSARLGRSGLWCLKCYGKPSGNYRVWLQQRCSGEQPVGAAPATLLQAVLRAGQPDAEASAGIRARHACLLALARVVPVPAAALPRGRQGETGQGQEHWVVLSGLGRSISHAVVPPGLDPSPPPLLDSEGCGLQAGVRPGAAFHPFLFLFSCLKFLFAGRQLFGLTCFWLGLGVIVGLETPCPPPLVVCGWAVGTSDRFFVFGDPRPGG